MSVSVSVSVGVITMKNTKIKNIPVKQQRPPIIKRECDWCDVYSLLSQWEDTNYKICVSCAMRAVLRI